MNSFEKKLFEKSNSNEDVFKSIESKKIDIEKFDGFLIWTQIPNVYEILKNGFKSTADINSFHWQYGGQIKHRGIKENPDGIYLTIYDHTKHSFNDGKYNWPKAGQVGVLINKNIDDQLYKGMKAGTSGNTYWEDVEHIYDKNITPNDICGLVLNKNLIQLEHPREFNSVKVPTPQGGFVDVKKNTLMNYSKEEYIDILKNRLTRLVETKYKNNLVPLYDNDGKIIWP